MTYTRKIYSTCCYVNEQPDGMVLTSSVQFATTDRLTLTDPFSMQNQFVSFSNVKAKPIVHLILRHENRTSAPVNPGGPRQLYRLLGRRRPRGELAGQQAWHNPDDLVSEPGKSRFEIALVYPTYDGSYDDRAKNNNLVPKHR